MLALFRPAPATRLARTHAAGEKYLAATRDTARAACKTWNSLDLLPNNPGPRQDALAECVCVAAVEFRRVCDRTLDMPEHSVVMAQHRAEQYREFVRHRAMDILMQLAPLRGALDALARYENVERADLIAADVAIDSLRALAYEMFDRELNLPE